MEGVQKQIECLARFRHGMKVGCFARRLVIWSLPEGVNSKSSSRLYKIGCNVVIILVEPVSCVTCMTAHVLGLGGFDCCLSAACLVILVYSPRQG